MSFKDIQPNLTEYFTPDGLDNLRGYLRRNEEGSTEDYRTPFWGRKPREDILTQWDKIFNKWYATSDQSIFSSLNDYEQDMRSKVGPLSIQAPLAERLEGIKEYWFAPTSNFPLSRIKDGFWRTVDEFSSIKGIRLRSRQSVVGHMKLSTNSGSPFFTRRRLVAEQTLNGKEVTQYKECAVLGWRGQEGGPNPEDVKQRTVFMMPFELNIDELRFYQPFIQAVQEKQLIPAYVSLELVERRMKALFDSKDPEDLVIATDFTKMDQHFNEGMQNIAKMIIYELLDRSDPVSLIWLDSVYHTKFNIPLLLSEDHMYIGDHGMGSGSGGTNADESLAHRCLQHEAAARQNQVLNPNSQYLGDDGILTYPGITVQDVVSTYVSYGMNMNPSKQYAAKDHTVYLRRWYHERYARGNKIPGVYSTYRALGRLMGQERYYDPKVWGPKMVTLRAWSILENCKNHPLFEELVKFVIKGDKFKLGMLIPGFVENVDATYAEAKAKLRNFESYSRELENQGIKNWEIYKLISKYMKTE